MTFGQLKDTTGLEPSELKKQLISLSLAEHPILKLVGETGPTKMLEQSEKGPLLSKSKSVARNFDKDSLFAVNLDFKSKLKRI